MKLISLVWPFEYEGWSFSSACELMMDFISLFVDKSNINFLKSSRPLSLTLHLICRTIFPLQISPILSYKWSFVINKKLDSVDRTARQMSEAYLLIEKDQATCRITHCSPLATKFCAVKTSTWEWEVSSCACALRLQLSPHQHCLKSEFSNHGYRLNRANVPQKSKDICTHGPGPFTDCFV